MDTGLLRRALQLHGQWLDFLLLEKAEQMGRLRLLGEVLLKKQPGTEEDAVMFAAGAFKLAGLDSNILLMMLSDWDKGRVMQLHAAAMVGLQVVEVTQQQLVQGGPTARPVLMAETCGLSSSSNVHQQSSVAPAYASAHIEACGLATTTAGPDSEPAAAGQATSSCGKDGTRLLSGLGVGRLHTDEDADPALGSFAISGEEQLGVSLAQGECRSTCIAVTDAGECGSDRVEPSDRPPDPQAGRKARGRAVETR